MASSPTPPTSSKISRGDIDRILSETFIDDVEFHHEIASTNDRALQRAKERPDNQAATLVLADAQTAGRGRKANIWWSGEGALTFSVLLPSAAIALPPSRWPVTSLATALAICAALDDLLGTDTAKVKWPNDVYLCDRKVCGILVEGTVGQRGALVLGVGINVNNSIDNAPDSLREKAIALCDVAQRQFSRADVLVGILQQLSALLPRLCSRDNVLVEEWRRRCLLTGRTVHIDLGIRRIAGKCLGIANNGALLLETDSGQELCTSGVIVEIV